MQTILNLGIGGLIIFLLAGFSCSRDSAVRSEHRPEVSANAVGSKLASPSPSTSPTPVIVNDNQLKEIRQVDFKNFSYDWYPKYCVSQNGEHRFTLHNGEFEFARKGKNGLDGVRLELIVEVDYSDLTGDGQEEAIVPINGSTPNNSRIDILCVYTFLNGKPKLIWKYEYGQTDNGLRAFDTEKQKLIVDYYPLTVAYLRCCPKSFIRQELQWTGQHFRLIKSQTLPEDTK